MRLRILASLCAAPLLVPTAALAQEAGFDDDFETDSMDVVDETPEVPQNVPHVPGSVTVAPGQVHTVVTGDTLWDLSQSYLGSPWYWPKVWSYNPEIANPNWIYPGNQVRFFPAGEGMPQQVAPAGPINAPPSEDEGSMSPLGEELPADLVTATGPLVYQQGAPTYPVASEGFVSKQEMEGVGEIAGSPSEAIMLAFGDEVYVRFRDRQDARVGDRYQIFRPGKAVHEPVSGRYLGNITHVIGDLVVTDMSAEMVTARIERSIDDIARGDRVGPAGENSLTTVRPRPNRVDLQGRVAASMSPVENYGEHHKLILDMGGRDGVEVGNSLFIVRSGDPKDHFMKPYQSHDPRFPNRVIGACVVLEVREEASICILTRSLKEIVAGDRVEMVADPAATARR